MAKKLVYNYTFTPGISNVGKIEINGNHPSRVWQLVTVTGTNGLYPHIFVRDEYASGAIQVISGGDGNLTISQSGTTFNETSGIFTVTTTQNHGLATGATIKFRELGVTFTCAKDNHETEHSYPRTTDPIYDVALPITVVDADTFTVYVGRPSGGAISSDNEIIYNFADPTKGGSTYYNAAEDVTILTLKHDTSHLDSRDDLQIFIDEQEEKIDFSETFIDPVSKLRVSNPQNLIDTDFEYGLQPTKWETVELVNNIPSFYASSTDYSIPDITSVNTIAGSESITVNTLEQHNLSVGSPIDVQSLSSRTAEGKFIITAVPTSTSFVYKSKGKQSSSGSINNVYTVITPGQFYAGSEIGIDKSLGIRTDTLPQSTLTIRTDYVHGFEQGSSVYLTNTIGKEIYNLTTQNLSSDAPDGRPYVDPDDTLSVNLTIDSSLTETKEMTGTYAYKFSSSAVNITNNTIEWPSHNLQPGDVLLYVPSAGDAQIGGLQRFQIYYVKSAPSANTITLCETTNGDYPGNSVIDFTSTGTSNYGRHQLILGYEIASASKKAQRYETEFYTRYYITGTGSGRDLYTFSSGGEGPASKGGYFGLGQTSPSRVIATQKANAQPTMSTVIHAAPVYSSRDNQNFTFGKQGTTPDGYDFIEDYNRFNNYPYQNNTYGYYQFNAGYFNAPYINNFDYSNQASENYNLGTTFIFLLKKDSEADSFFIANHGLNSGSLATINTAQGNDIFYRSDTSSFYGTSPIFTKISSGTSANIKVISPDRISFSAYSRISRADGTYSLIGSLDNPTSNSFYLGSNNLSENQTIFLSAISEGPTSGVLPTTTTGVVQPTTSTITNVYSAMTSALDSIKTTMGDDTWDLIYNGRSETDPINSRQMFSSNGLQYINIGRSSVNLNKYSSSGSYLGQTRAELPQTGFANGQRYDLFQNTSSGGLGYEMITSPYSENTTTPYWIDLYQIPYEPGISRTELYYSSWFMYNFSTNGTLDNRDDFYTNWITLSNGWRYHYDTNYIAPSVQNWHGYICMALIIDNSSWQGYYATPSPRIYFPGNRYMTAYTFGAMGQRYLAHIIIPVKVGTQTSRYGAQGSVLTNAQIASQIATEISTTLVNPSFSGQTDQEARVSIVDASRIRLIDPTTNNFYNLTNSGTSPLAIETDEITGAIDGYYTISSTSSEEFDLELNSTVPSRVFEFDHTKFQEFDGIKYINIPNHKLETSQIVTFNTGTGTAENLTNATNYYAVPNGPDYLALAINEQDASGGNIVSVGTVTQGTFSIVAQSISGISPGLGTVDLTAESTTINGTDTLFKRFYKQGDDFIYKDTSTTPPSYKSLVVASVIDDTILTTTQFPGADVSNTVSYVRTKVNVRPDGTFLHRPFDGGVEITAGTSPNSSIARQTRKYFRYQSGKGIQCSLAINFNPSRVAVSLTSSDGPAGSVATVTTQYPHGLTTNNRVTIKGSGDPTYNGTFDVTYADTFTFKYDLPSKPFTSIPDGIIEYNIDSWTDSVIRAGLFDYQNGFFFEFDGSTLYAVRRSSVQQLPGAANVEKGSNIVSGNNTSFSKQLTAGNFIVMRGLAYRVTHISSDTELHIQPAYKGSTSSDIIVTKTVDTRVAQSDWNIDKADGKGPSGFLLDITKIQMCYLDYSWYGAGKIRFGFKDTYGHVKYMHEFRHNNRIEEAYMRSGNIPGRYEIENKGTPTYIPSLFHWGTSVIMDGRFDDDKAYLFTASSRSLIFTNGSSSTSTTNASSALTSQYNFSARSYDWYVRLSFPVADASKFTTGTPLYTTDNTLKGETVSFTQYSGSSIFVYIYVQTSRSTPAVYPVVGSGTAVSIGAPSGAAGGDVDLTKDVPLISIRLAPSVDNNLTGALGEREIINRMQLQLKSLGMTLSHDCEVDLILNGSISNLNFENATNPSLSELVRHEPGDKVINGTVIFSLRASGGSVATNGKRLSSTTDFDLSQITDLGNSILGGDGVFPNGPDLLTIAIKPVDTSEINATTPLTVSSRITWTESQA